MMIRFKSYGWVVYKLFFAEIGQTMQRCCDVFLYALVKVEMWVTACHYSLTCHILMRYQLNIGYTIGILYLLNNARMRSFEAYLFSNAYPNILTNKWTAKIFWLYNFCSIKYMAKNKAAVVFECWRRKMVCKTDFKGLLLSSVQIP